MFRRRLDVIACYEVIGQPVVGATGLSYRPWVACALQPYAATRLPIVGARSGLHDALVRAAAA